MKTMVTMGVAVMLTAVVEAGNAPLGFPPYVDITTTPAWVTHDVTSYTIGGTNNPWVTNVMTWSTSAGFSGSFAAAQAWVVSNIPLVVGPNVITVRGWDDFRRTSTDSVVITRGDIGTGQPYVDVTSEAAWVSYDVSTHTISGTNNIHTVGQMVWVNSLGGSGSVPAGQTWSIAEIPLEPGENIITVTATNQLGVASSDSVAITRGAAGTGVPHVDVTNSTMELVDDIGPCTIAGTNNLNVVGGMWWTNSQGGCGVLAAGLHWQIDGIALREGTNHITVAGTNAFGVVSSDEVMIVCRLTRRILQTVLHSAPTPPPGYERTARVMDWQDAHINATWAEPAAGRDEAMYLGKSSRIIVSGASVPGLLPPDVFRARLRLYNGGYYERTPLYWRARLVTAAWDDDEVTWFERLAGTPWGAPGGDTASAPEARGWAVIHQEGYHDFDITALVRVWRGAPSNYYGVLIETASENAAMYVTADNGPDDVQQQPYILIDHAVVPLVDITNENTRVVNAVTTYEIGGTNNVHVVGMMTWSNSLMAGVYTFAAAPAWRLSDISLGVGRNIITVIGTNAFGDAHADSIIIDRDDVDAGTGAPLTVVTNQPVVVMNDVAVWSVGGSNNHHVVGGMRWENSLGGSGSFPATPYWTVAGIPLGVGANVLTVTGTNTFGQASSASVTITRREPGTGAPFVDITNQNVIVPPEEVIYAIGGTNNAQVAGWMVWTNLLTRANGMLPASLTWEIEDLLLDVGHNVIVVYGTNKFGAAASDQVVISRSPGAPEVAITTPDTVVSNEVSSVGIQGAAGEYVVGGLTWSNELTGLVGSMAAGAVWQAHGIGVEAGANVIRVTGTNMVGQRASAAVTITRLPAGSGAPRVMLFTLDTIVSNEVELYTVAGTNNHHVVGTIVWTNTLSGAAGAFAAGAAAWQITGLTLVVGANEIAVRGTNMYGVADTARVTITRLPEGSGMPQITLLTPDTVVTNEISTFTVVGTNNRHVVGAIVWSNTLNGAAGWVAPSTAQWAIADVDLAVGQNVIQVIGTNLYGVSATGVVQVIRMPEGNWAPEVVITTPAAEVTYKVSSTSIAGVANEYTVGGMVWSNALTQTSGSVAAGANWVIHNVALGIGANVISVRGTNEYGLAHVAQVTITRLPVGSDPPEVVILTTNMVVTNEVASITIHGTNNLHVMGGMTWSNALNEAAGTLAATPVWSIADIPLAIGTNVISVYGTNMFGASDWASVTITRRPNGSGAPDVILYTTNHTVTHEVTLVTLAGSNNHHVVGMLVWSNRQMRVAGSVPATREWVIEGVPVQVGQNVIDVTGTNMFGWRDTASVTITRLPYGSGTPEIIIETTNSVVANEVTSYTVVGSNKHVVGVMHWTNLLTLARGTLSATPTWSINNIGLEVGDNVILVTGTNMYGVRATQTVRITRLPVGSGVPEIQIYTTNTVVTNEVTSFTISGTNNRHVVGHMLCTNVLTGASQWMPAVAPWVVSNIGLAIGTNVIHVRGTNMYGDVAQAEVAITRLPYGSGTPRLDVITTNSTVAYESVAMAIVGSNNHHVVGLVVWTNALTGGAGSIAAAPMWEIAAVSLGIGDNVITVSGTNMYGNASTKQVIIRRLPAGSGVPDIVLLTRNTVVTNAVQFFRIEGTNNPHVVGRMRWMNYLTLDSGTRAAATEWNVNIILDEGANVFEITGTNMYGASDTEQVTITRLPAGIHAPELAIITPGMTVPVEEAAVAITGTCSGADGELTWQNSASGTGGSVAATPVWVIPAVGLDYGTNVISVTATNRYGLTTGRQVTMVRAMPAAAPRLEEFSIVYQRTSGTAVLTWSNISAHVDVWVSRELYYRTNAAVWQLAETNVVSPWHDRAAGQWTASYYRLVSGGVTSAYDVGFMSVYVRQADGANQMENWLSSPFDFMDARGALVTSLPFAMLGVEAVVNNEPDPPGRRDVVFTRDANGNLQFAARGNGDWHLSEPTATNWYRNQMYNIVINRVHRGVSKRLTLFGRVSTNAPAVVAQVWQSDGRSARENWCAAWYPWVVAFTHARVADVVTDEAGAPTRRDKVASQSSVGRGTISAARGNGVWVTTTPAATNLYPGQGYKIIINKTHTGATRTWSQPRTMP